MTKSASQEKAPSRLDRRTAEERIRARAYELFEERGGEEGYDWEDWFRAEEQIAVSD